ncbi:MAG: TatD family hydrolase [Muribaculaceae bacterium]|nr:TatD family hydrolase [Muribaculaceae bacterium]
MTRCLDIHTHHSAPQPQAVVSASYEDFDPQEGQLYSLGIHPWTSYNKFTNDQWADFQIKASLPCVVAIGECGIDRLKGGPMYNQLLIFNRQVEISEKLKKPLIIHDVKAHEIVTGMKRDINPTQKWLVHGFRYKPTVAKMLTEQGIYLSFGEHFNEESLRNVPREKLLAETDESPLSIEQIIANLSATLGEDITELIAINTGNFLYGNNILTTDDEIEI